MKTGKLTKNSGHNSDWKIIDGNKTRPLNWAEIPLDWDQQEIEFEMDNGVIQYIFCNGKKIYNPNSNKGQKVGSLSTIKQNLEKEERNTSNSTHHKNNSDGKKNTQFNKQDSNQKKEKTMKPSETPYNFVPLNDKVIPSNAPVVADRSSFSGLSGYIDIKIEALTHLFIKGTSYDFFKVGDKYGIPGSSLRGMIRNLVEIATFGKFENYNDNFINYRLADASNPVNRRDYERIVEPIVQGRKIGFMDNDGNGHYIISQAEWMPNPTNRHAKHEYHSSIDNNKMYVEIKTIGVGDSVDFDVKYEKKSDDPYKLHEDVVSNYKNDTMRDVEGEMKDLLQTVNNSNNNIRKFCIDNGQLYIGIPVWYQLDANDEVESFGHCRNYRIPYKNAIGDAGPKILNQSEQGQDFASSIFGFVKDMIVDGKKTNKQQPGKVFFEDATSDAENITTAVLQILAAPKPKSGKLYLEPKLNGEQGRWDNNPHIRGYKMYWHRNTDNRPIEDDIVGEGFEQVNWQKTRFRESEEYNKFRIREYPDFNTGRLGYGKIKDDGTNASHYVFTRKLSDVNNPTITNNISKAAEGNGADQKGMQFKVVNTLQPTTKFTGARIRYEHMTSEELGALLFVLNLPTGCHHKIGMGKSIGLGSIKLTTKLTLIERAQRYQSLFSSDKQSWHTGASVSDPKTHIEAFTSYMNGELKHTPSFWDHPRMQALKIMLTFDPSVNSHHQYLEATNYMALSQFKDMGNLQTPEELNNQVISKIRP